MTVALESVRTRIVSRPLDAAALVAEVADPSCGATSLFIGAVRDVNEGRGVTGIDYTAYIEMAERELAKIAEEAVQQYGPIRLAVEHRMGELAVGEASVIIAAASPHRAPALDATRYIIEALKRRLPIWKREHYTDGPSEWVGAAE